MRVLDAIQTIASVGSKTPLDAADVDIRDDGRKLWPKPCIRLGLTMHGALQGFARPPRACNRRGVSESTKNSGETVD